MVTRGRKRRVRPDESPLTRPSVAVRRSVRRRRDAVAKAARKVNR